MLTRSATAKLATVSQPPTGVSGRALTKRELQVLFGMSRGMTNAQIGSHLHLSEDTIKTHAKHVYRKLDARDRAHAVAQAFRSGLVT
jgi:DNA-binding NarL/FixJ family response regulator